MNRAETLRQSAAAKNRESIEKLASQAAEQVRQARSAEQLIEAVSPLLRALASCTEQTGQVLSNLQSATVQAQQAASSLSQASSRLETSHYLVAIGSAVLTGLSAATVAVAIFIWRAPALISVQMDPKVVAEQLRSAGVGTGSGSGSTKPSKGK